MQNHYQNESKWREDRCHIKMDIYSKSPGQMKKMHGIHLMRKAKLESIYIRTVRGRVHKLSASNESLLE